MTSMGVRAAFAFLLLFVATVKAARGGVTFSGLEFTMTCPGEEDVKWFNEKGQDKPEGRNDSNSFTMAYKKKGFYRCEYKEDSDTARTYYFYVQGKVCLNCHELDSLVFLMAIVIDILMTICVMFIIYKCTKKKGPAGPAHTSKPPPRSAGRAGGQPGQNSEYEQLNLNTRANDTYSKVNRTG